jgi:glycosyltransferase involved in cell wall biosynthesis
MDLVGDMLGRYLARDHSERIAVRRICPPMQRRFTRIPLRSGNGGANPGWSHRLNTDRVLNRFGDYPWLLRRSREMYDLFHVVDHSYAQLLHVLPAERTIVTCHDLDTFRFVLEPGGERRSVLFRSMTRQILRGLQKAARVLCDSSGTRDEIVAYGLLPPERISVVPIGVHPSCSPNSYPAVEERVAALLGRPDDGSVDILHVGSTIKRKRIDILLRVFAEVRAAYPGARLIRVGGAFTPEQSEMVGRLGLEGSVLVLPTLDRETLAGVYRRATIVLQPSDREGFGLPLVEALACGTPVIASDIPVLRETGGEAATYCPPGDVPRWSESLLAALAERTERPHEWEMRRTAGLAHARRFDWSETVRQIRAVYEDVLAN